MGKLSVTAHMLVKNEDRFVWYAISSILPFVDKFLIFDTGSSDKTISIIGSLKDKKIHFEKKVIKEPEEVTTLRNEQIEKTTTDWFWIVDGDEIYPFHLCREILTIIKKDGERLEGIVVGRYELLGDIYHYQDESVGAYNLFGRHAHIVLRLINKKKIPGLHVEGKYPYEGYYDKNKREIITHNRRNFAFTKGKLFHAVYLKRSSLGANLYKTFNRRKWKIERGKNISIGEVYPEVFSSKRPSFVGEVTSKRSMLFELMAFFITPVKRFKRKLWAIFK